MADLIDPGELGDEIARMMAEYTSGVEDAIKPAVDRVTRAAVKDLRARSPRKFGDYAKGWGVKKIKGGGEFEGRVIYNKTDYQLTHLLEHGHAFTNGGRAQAYPHIGPVGEAYGAKLLDEMKVIISTGGGR